MREAIRQAGAQGRRGFSADGAGVVSKNSPRAANKVNGMFQPVDIDLRLRTVHLILKTIEDAGGIWRNCGRERETRVSFRSDVEIKHVGDGGLDGPFLNSSASGQDVAAHFAW
jgi:hypothetical protein